MSQFERHIDQVSRCANGNAVPDPCAICFAAAALEKLAIPPGTERVIFKTLNTKKCVPSSELIYEPAK